MISIANLKTILQKLNQDYLKTGEPPEHQLWTCKQALLEVCGWSEEAQDSILLACSAKVTDSSLKSHAEEKIRRNSGFSNDANFAPLLGLIIGLQSLSDVRSHLRNSGVHFPSLESWLNNLKNPRNAHAHTHFDHTNQTKTQHLQHSPAVMLQMAEQMNNGFIELEAELKSRGFC